MMVGDVELHYVEQGQGEVAILLHGGQGDYRAWPSLIEVLAPRYRVISYSRRYHWPNANPFTATNHSALIDADDLAGLIAALRLGAVHPVGTSYGAFTALALAIKHPELVRSMVVAEPPVHQWVTDTTRGATLYQQRVATAHKPAGDSSDPFPNLSKDAVRRLQMPVLIVRGADTDDLHRMITEELARLLPDAERLTVPRAGHGSPRQNAPAFNAAVLEFLNGRGKTER